MSAIIEELSLEKNLSSFLENRIFKPLGMSHSYLPTISEQWQMINQLNQDKKMVIRYTADTQNTKAKPIRIDQITYKPPLVFRIPVASAGAIISCMSDLVKWQESLYGGNILSEDSLKLMTTGYIKVDEDLDVSGEDMYGYGLMTGKIGDKKIYYHGGWLLGVRTILSYNPENGVSVIALSNLSTADNQWKRNTFRQVGSLTELVLELQGVVVKFLLTNSL